MSLNYQNLAIANTIQFNREFYEAVQYDTSQLEQLISSANKKTLKDKFGLVNYIGTTEVTTKQGEYQQSQPDALTISQREYRWSSFTKQLTYSRDIIAQSGQTFGTEAFFQTQNMTELKNAIARAKEKAIFDAIAAETIDIKGNNVKAPFNILGTATLRKKYTIWADAAGVSAGIPETETGTKTGLTVEKILLAKSLMSLNNKSTSFGKPYLLVTENEKIQLLNDAKATNFDYTSKRTLDGGNIEEIVGVQLITLDPSFFNVTGSVGNKVRDLYMITPETMAIVKPEEPVWKTGENPAASFQPIVHLEFSYGATRIRDEQFLRIRAAVNPNELPYS
jgi:hypothetical protein